MTASTPSTDGSSITRPFTILVIAFTVVMLAVIVGMVLIAINVSDGAALVTTVEVLRDLFVILLSLVLLLIGAAFAVMLMQVARFANLLQNEVRPILESSTEAVNTIRGTATFVSQHVVEPVLKVNEMMAGARQAMNLMRDLGALRDIATAAAAAAASQGGAPSEQHASETD